MGVNPAVNRALTERLMRLTAPLPRETTLSGADAIVTHVEVNDHHGVGVLLRRLFGADPNVVSIRSRELYGGRQEFGALRLSIAHQHRSRDQVLWNVLSALRGTSVKRILCVPYFPDDALNAIALRELFGAPLCTYLMDDQNLCVDGIADALIAELLEKSSLRLAISAELAAGYEAKFAQKMWLMPPVVPARFILDEASAGSPAPASEAVILGNIWGSRWVELLRETVRGSGITLRWHNNGEFRWLPCPLEALAADGILPQRQACPDEKLVEILRAAAFVVLPSGTLDDTDDRRAIAQLSLPSRIPYVMATSHAPLLVLGHPETAAARFVRRHGIGLVAPYQRGAFLDAAARIAEPETNRRLREAARRLAPRYSDRGAARWIWESLAAGQPADSRYRDLDHAGAV